MASTRSVIDEVDIEEQRRLQIRIEQERKDREYAERLYREQFETPPRPIVVNRRGRTEAIRGRGGGRRTATPRRRGSNGNVQAAGNNPRAASGARALTSSSTGPIRRGATRVLRGGPTSTRGRQTTRARRAESANAFHFNGDRLQARRGNEIVDITAEAYFPDDEDDTDYIESDGDPDDEIIVLSSPASSSDVDTDPEPQPRRRNGQMRMLDRRFLLNADLAPDNVRNDPLFEESESDDSDGENEVDSDGSDEDSDDDDIIIDEFGPIRAEPNHINQPIFDEDRQMYNRELDLYHDDDEYQVPPASIPMNKGKAIEPDSTWGDCTMCSNPPVKPQGCRKCLQFLGCADCVRRWHAARQGSYEKPNCPLCRAPWNGHSPGVQLMPTIEKHRLKNQNKPSSSSGPSTSSAS